MPKKYDLFISYSSKDREFVYKLANDLKGKTLVVWFDHWEMKPGDRLRDRINDGIAHSKYFLVVLSPNSVRAPWVRVELDSAMIKELEDNRIVVIPTILGGVSNTDIPPDLKGKHYLDFREPAQYSSNLDRIVNIFNLEKRERKRVFNNLRRGNLDHQNPIEHLTYLACKYGDQTVQRAAITGLSKHATNPKAILGIAERLLDMWGLTTIKHTLQVSARLTNYGGLILLSSTLFYDDRFILEKLILMKKSLVKLGDVQAASEINSLGDVAEIYREPLMVNT